MEKTVGIELVTYTSDRVVGRLTTSKVGVKIDNDGHIVVTQEITGPVFTLSLITGKLGVHSGTIEQAQEVGKKLMDIGFKPTKLIFNEQEYEF